MDIFRMNHVAGSMEDILGVSKEELIKLTEEDTQGDYPFAALLFTVLRENEDMGMLLGSILGGILDREFERPSEIIEYVVQTVPKGMGRKRVSIVAMHMGMKNLGIDL